MRYKDRYLPMAGRKPGVTYTPVVAARLWYAYHYVPLGPMNWVYSREELAHLREVDQFWAAKAKEFTDAVAQVQEHKGVMAELVSQR